MNSRNQQAIKEFEDTRTLLQYEYPKVNSATRLQRYSLIDRAQGVKFNNYDVIGNLLVKSPFNRMEWFNVSFVQKDFKEQWDVGRTILVSTIGNFDCYRNGKTHLLYWVLRLVPIIKNEKHDSE